MKIADTSFKHPFCMDNMGHTNLSTLVPLCGTAEQNPLKNEKFKWLQLGSNPQPLSSWTNTQATIECGSLVRDMIGHTEQFKLWNIQWKNSI